jgi:cobalamin biosynthesis protein CobW
LEELFEDQIHAADLIVLNKADLIDASRLDGVKADVAARSPRRVNMVPASFGKLGTDVLLGLGVGTEDDIANRKSHHEIHHADGHEHDHDEFESFVVEAGSVGHPKLFAEKLKTVIAEHDILRLKGFVDVPGKPMRLVVQAVGPRIEHYFDRPWDKDETRSTRLVVIGLHDIDEAAIAKAVKDAVS